MHKFFKQDSDIKIREAVKKLKRSLASHNVALLSSDEDANPSEDIEPMKERVALETECVDRPHLESTIQGVSNDCKI